MAPDNLGTQEEPIYHFENVYNELEETRGKTVETLVRPSFGSSARPTPTGAEHYMTWKHGSPANGKALRPKARELLEQLIAHHKNDRHVKTEPDRDFKCSDINVTGENGSHGWHQDAQPYGSLLFLFVVGNSSENVFRMRGKHSKDERIVVLRSGDCLVFEGQTWHTVRQTFPKTSPFKNKDAWLHNRRMSVLVRQRPPKTKVHRPHYLKK